METEISNFSTGNLYQDLGSLAMEFSCGDDADLQTALLIMKMLEDKDPELKAELGDCYYSGRGLRKDIEKGVEKFEEAAEEGSLTALYHLGWYYYDRKDYLQAADHFEECLKHKETLDDLKLRQTYTTLGDACSKLPEPDMDAAIRYLSVAADRYNDGFACYRLAGIYENMEKPDVGKIMRYAAKGSENGNGRAACILAGLYVYNDERYGIPRDRAKALESLSAYMDDDDDEINKILGDVYFVDDQDHHLSSDYNKAAFYYQKAWDLGGRSLSLVRNLGYSYYYISEYEKAREFLTIADENGDYSYSDFLGRMYYQGQGVEKDLAKASQYYGHSYRNGEMSNRYTLNEYIGVLEEYGDYETAYEACDKGFSEYRDIAFGIRKAKYILKHNVYGKMPEDQAALLMERCLQADALGKHSGDRLLLGEYYYGSKEYRKAEKLLQEVYGKDDPETKPEAAMLLGQIYQYGAGSINADFEKAKNYYLYVLTEQNSSEAAYRMATLYERGAGRIKPDVNTAVTWYEKAADMGNRKAEEELKHFRKGFFGGYSRI